MAKCSATKQIDLFDQLVNIPVSESQVGDRVKWSNGFNSMVGILKGFQKVLTSEFVLVKFADYLNYPCAKANLSFAEVES